MIMGISFKFAFPTDLTQSLKRLAHYLASMAGAGFGSASIRSPLDPAAQFDITSLVASKIRFRSLYLPGSYLITEDNLLKCSSNVTEDNDLFTIVISGGNLSGNLAAYKIGDCFIGCL